MTTVLKLLTAAAVMATPAQADAGGPITCANATQPCEIEGVIATLPSPYSVSLNVSLTIKDSILTGMPCDDKNCGLGQFDLFTSGNLTLLNTTIRSASVNITVRDTFYADNATWIAADGMGPEPSGFGSDPGEGVEGTGGGHAGSGSYVFACRQGVPSSNSGLGYGFGTLASPYEFGGGSSGFGSKGRRAVSRGGGRIWLQVGETLLLGGSVTADGGDGEHVLCDNYQACGPGGGGGGSVYLLSYNITLVQGSGFLSAVGGDSADDGGGGGGVISVVALGSAAGLSQSASVNVTGGICRGTDCSSCPVGGTGLIYLAQLEGSSLPVNPDDDRKTKIAPPMRVSDSEILRRRWQRAPLSPSEATSRLQHRRRDARQLLEGCIAAREESRKRHFKGLAGEVHHHELCASQYPHLAELLAARVPPSNDEQQSYAAASADGQLAAPRPSAVLYCSSESDVSSTDMPLIQTAVTSDLAAVVFTDLVLQNCAYDLSSLTSLSLQSMSLTSSIISSGEILFSVNGTALATDSSRITTTGASQGVRFMPVSNMKLVSAIISGGYVTVTGKDLTIGTNAFCRFSFFASLVASGTLTVQNELSQVDVPSSATELTVTAANITVASSGRILAGRVFMLASDTATIDGLLTTDPTAAFRDSEPCTGQPKPAVTQDACQYNTYNENAGYPMWITAQTMLVQKSGQVSAPALKLCVQSQLSVAAGGAVSAAALGCSQQSGYGAGMSSTDTPSSGAGHGGAGGSAGVLINKLNGGKVYDNVSWPSMLGSSGGDPLLGGSGGGIISIETSDLVNNGEVTVSGAAGTQGTVTAQGGGGGSGGSLVLRIASLTGTGTFDASGGAGGGPGAGGGGGGLINVLWRNGSDLGLHLQPQHSALMLPRYHSPLGFAHMNRFGGLLINTGGSAIYPGAPGGHGHSQSDPTCGPGAGGALCLPCAPGTAKDVPGNAWCEECSAGFYANSSGNTLCLKCDDMSVAPSPGAALCQACPPSLQPNFNRTSCSLCAPGYGGPDCSPCDSGTYQPNATETSGQCLPCPAGTYSGPMATECTPCGPGRFAPQEGSSECDYCDVGSISVYPFTTCIPCQAGTFSNSNECLGCPVNTFSGFKSSSCTDCTVGTFSTGNASSCMLCPPIPAHASFLPNSVNASTPSESSAFASGFSSGMMATAVFTVSSWVGRQGGDIPPPHAGTCSFICLPGYLDYPNCVTPVTVAFNSAGGFYTFSITLIIGLAIVLPVLVAPKDARRLPLPLRSFVSGGPAGSYTLEGGTDDVLLNIRAGEAAAYWDALKMDDSYEAVSWRATIARGQEALKQQWLALLASIAASASGMFTGAASDDRNNSTNAEDAPYITLGGEDSIEDAAAAPHRSRKSSGGLTRVSSNESVGALQRTSTAGGPSGTPPMHRVNTSGPASSEVLLQPYGTLGGNQPDSAWTATDVIQRHLHRVFFHGSNTPSQPLCLPPGVPLELSAYVSEPEWADYCHEVTELGRWAPWEARLANVLRAVYHPAALSFEATRRAAAIRRLATHHSDFSHDFLRNTRAR